MKVVTEVVEWVLGKWCYIITTSLKSLNAVYVTLIPNKNNTNKKWWDQYQGFSPY